MNCLLDKNAIDFLEKEIPVLHYNVEIGEIVKFFYSWRENDNLFFVVII